MNEERDPSYPYGEFDAQKWAEEFMRIHGDRKVYIDEELMIGWFANAIMTGYDKARNEVYESFNGELAKGMIDG